MEWKTPDPAHAARWATRLAPLREHPHRWASYGFHHHSARRDIAQGLVADVKPGEFEAVMRGGGQHRAELFVRYVGAPPCECGCLQEAETA